MTPEEIAKLRELVVWDHWEKMGEDLIYTSFGSIDVNTGRERDTDFIVGACNSLHTLLDEVERLTASAEAAEAKIADAVSIIERELAEPPTDISTEFANKVLDALK